MDSPSSLEEPNTKKDSVANLNGQVLRRAPNEAVMDSRLSPEQPTDDLLTPAASPTNDKFYTKKIESSEFNVPKRYANLEYLSAGAQGTVVSAYDLVTKKKVAIKKMQQPFVMTLSAKRAYREFVLLSSIKHPNIIPLYSAFTPQGRREDFKEVYLVMELMSYNLCEVIQKLRLDHKTLSFFVYQILCAVNHLHKHDIIHRDLKPSNIVVDEKCVLKVLDFGLARVADNAKMSDYVVTRWYRAPEILCGAGYNEKVDIWSIGCIFAELINHRVLFPGGDPGEQWRLISNILGTPSEAFIQRVPPQAQVFFRKQPYNAGKNIKQIVPDDAFLRNTENPTAKLTAGDARGLLQKMLVIDPEKRCSVQEALKHPYVTLWHREEEVQNNAPLSESRYDKSHDLIDKDLEEWKSLIFDEVKQFEAGHDVFGGDFNT